MQLHTLTKKTPNRKKKIVGRGGKRGTYSGRGVKGQKARAGSKLRPEVRDMLKKIPKRRGYGKNRSRTVNPTNRKPEVVNVSALSVFTDTPVTPQTLLEKKLVKRSGGSVPIVKILGTGTINNKVTVEGCLVSEAAAEKIKKAGGSIK
ncbi:50S ribosomal protein L15 [bacterium]|nr:50S ribosomal protein L15 [bacterium]|tara:strand:+ start:14163 stop:14606 length:444 start_codon:yes stop_codon:yes gene_type:complete